MNASRQPSSEVILNKLRADHLVLEFARRGYDELEVFRDLNPNIGLGVGVVDIKDNEIESPQLIASRVETIIRKAGEGRLKYIHPDCGFWMLHRSVADRKMRALVEGRDLKAIFLDDFLFGKSDRAVLPHLQDLARRAGERWGVYTEGNTTAAKVHRQTACYLDGILIGPSMVALAREGVFDLFDQAPDGVDPKEIPGNPRSLACVFELLESQGWLEQVRNRLRLTSHGRYASQIASSYGVTVSYLPLFEMLGTLLFGAATFPRVDESGGELLVNRGMNVWGSGGAHNNYFKKSDEIIIGLFNRPIDQQPLGVCDMGCGDGSLLAHVYFIVMEKTMRGAALDARPLILVGADVSKVARRISKQRLRKAGIPNFHVIQGDINRPAHLASELERLGLDIHDLLNVRSFLDHNRPYLPPANYICGSRQARTSGAFAYLGEEIPPDELEENLVRHLRRWAPYVGRFGLLVMELHTLPPQVTAANLDRTLAVAYDATHGFSDQYLIELDVFLACAREAGLAPDERFQAKFPPSDLATISINFFTAEVLKQ